MTGTLVYNAEDFSYHGKRPDGSELVIDGDAVADAVEEHMRDLQVANPALEDAEAWKTAHDELMKVSAWDESMYGVTVLPSPPQEATA